MHLIKPNNQKRKLDLSSETLALVSPSAAAFTQGSPDEVTGKNDAGLAVRENPICSTEGCVLAGNKIIIFSPSCL